jgi:Cu-Zn family superoxide dismutase
VRRTTLSLAVIGAVVGGGALTMAAGALAPASPVGTKAIDRESGDREPGGRKSGEASATLTLADGTAVGSVRFGRDDDGATVEVTLDIPPRATAVGAFHGFHVHANDDATNGEGCVADPAGPAATWFTSADGHLKEGDQTHGSHVGDMPPLDVDADGRAHASFTTSRLDVDKLTGRVVVLHGGPDNLGNVPTGPGPDQYTPNSQAAVDKTKATGNAGDRVACGVIRNFG